MTSRQFPSGDPRPEHRVRIISLIFIALFVIYTLKLFSMQIVHGEVYRLRAESIARRVTVIPAQRGEIFDRNFTQPLVFNTDSFAVSITPAEVPDGTIPDLISQVAHILGIERDIIDKKIPVQYYYLYQPVEVAVNVPFSTIAALAEQADSLPGVSWQSKPMRTYGDLGSLSHILGYVGDITRDELTMLYNKGYQAGDKIGKTGIERQYDELLRGKEGKEIRTVDVRGRGVASERASREAPVTGKNLVLSIDQRIQVLAEQALGKRIGAVVVLRPTTGEILAMVSYPWYDPNIFNQNDNGAIYQAMINDPNKPFI
ncbi:MAG: penicillin-binding protein 2, partial [Spirochaetaceae bacterium]|nr:penicillin-binding protein 2 [Spirochaetaceae bacterium]